MNDYSYFKVLLWRLLRTSISGGIGMVVLMNTTIKPDWSNASVVFHTIAAAFLSGFISALALAIRDSISDGDKSAGINKMPI